MRTTFESSFSQRAARLLHPAFLLALALLIFNDAWLKALFHNALTGKLSDFAGVFAFAFFWSALAGRREAAIHALVGVAFAIWKSPLSQPAIEAWNALGVWPVARVVDASDVLALAVLPVSWRLVRAPRVAARIEAMPGPAWAAKWTVAAIAVFAFTATSKAPHSLAIEADYLTAYSTERIKEIVRKDDDRMYAYGERLRVQIEIEDCDRAGAEFSAHAHGGRTLLRLHRADGQCGKGDLGRDAVLAAVDAKLASAFAAHRVKAGVGPAGDAIALADPPAEQCPNETARSAKPAGAPNSDGSEPTYPPKSRRRATPDAPQAPNASGAATASSATGGSTTGRSTTGANAEPAPTAPAASPETPSPSAARNSN